MRAVRRRNRITVLIHYNRISLLYSLAPLLLAKDVAGQLDFTQSAEYCLRRDRNRTLLILRFFEGLPNRAVDLHLMARLREKYDRIAFFDDADGCGCTRFEILPYVDVYLKKQLFRDPSVYRRPLYGRELHTDYYHKRFGVEDARPYYRQPIEPSEEGKLQVAWNLGVGSFPIHPSLQRLGVAAARLVSGRLGFRSYRHPSKYKSHNRHQYNVHARFRTSDDRPTVFHQRKLLLKELSNRPQFLTGPVDPRRYQQEMRHSKITLSPFGWGEICFRDFEAVLNDSMLLKPNMDHLATWPDIYRPFDTYVPIDWNCGDAVGRAAEFLESGEARRRIVENAKDVYFDSLRRIEERVQSVVNAIMGPETILAAHGRRPATARLRPATV